MTIFWMAFIYGLLCGLIFWCKEVLQKEWMAHAAQPVYG